MRFWTRQHEAVWDELQKTGQYIVKKKYIEAKNDTISEFYLKLYEWYTKAARKYIDIPEDLKYPVWLSVSEDMMLQPTEHAIIFEVEIPLNSATPPPTDTVFTFTPGATRSGLTALALSPVSGPRPEKSA